MKSAVVSNTSSRSDFYSLTFPAILHHDFGPPPKPIPINRKRRKNKIEKDIIEERLKGRDGSPLHREEGSEGASGSVEDGEDLPINITQAGERDCLWVVWGGRGLYPMMRMM